MITKRPSAQRGYADHGWLKSYHSFSFADYYDPDHMGFGNLRVINEDVVAPGTGFGMHPHRDMEIITVILDGALSHRDSMGHGETIRPGEVQYMSAGQGVLHSEFNQQSDASTHLLQIWILPEQMGVTPRYAQQRFPVAENAGRLVKVASRDGDQGSIRINADASLYLGRFERGQHASVAWPAGRLAYVHLALGELTVNGERLQAGDALMMKDVPTLDFAEGEAAQVLVFDLAH
jgi:redox-sensitive bicupin YhaK (pirin superfamily)